MAYKAATTVDELAAQLQDYGYTPKTDAEMRAQAEQLYQNQYDSSMLSAKQTYDTSDAALANQLATLGTSYDRQIRSQKEATAQSISSADRQMLSRGMQRSSYNSATLANLRLKGDQALADIEADRTNAESSIASQRSVLAQQYAENQAAARSTFENNVLARIQELMDEQYTRQQTASANTNEILFNLYNLALNEKNSSSSGGSYNQNTSGNDTGDGKDASAAQKSWAQQMSDLANSLSGASSSKKKVSGLAMKVDGAKSAANLVTKYQKK